MKVEVPCCSCGLPTTGDEYVLCPVHDLVAYGAPPATKTIEAPPLPGMALVGAHLCVETAHRLWHCAGCGDWLWFPIPAEESGSEPYCLYCNAKGRGLYTMVPTDVVRSPNKYPSR